MQVQLPGPYTYSSDYDEVQEAKYNHVFHVTLQMIQNHIDSIQSGSTTYRPDPNILFWPGNGDPSIGQPAIIAPFADLNNNGKYEPMLGEYPLIYGNDCSFNVTHYPDKGDPSKAMAFRFWTYTQHCDTANVYKNVVFRKIEVISHGVAFDSLQFGDYCDGDIGFSEDDYVGTNVNLGMGYFYNGTLYDPGQSGLPGLHDTLAAAGILYLKGFKQADDGIDNAIGVGPNQSVNGYGFNDGIVDNEYKGMYASVEPDAQFFGSFANSWKDWKNILNGLFLTGDSIGYGGNANVPQDTIYTRYIYPYKQDSLHYGTNGVNPGFPWSEFNLYKDTLQATSPIDNRLILSYGSGALHSGEKITFDYAIIASRDQQHTDSIIEPVLGLFAKARRVRSAFLSNEGPCGIHFNLPPNTL